MQRGGNRFYFDFQGNRGILPDKEAHHLIRVCRKKIGEEITLINGKGKEFLGKIVSLKEKGKKILVEVEILKLIREEQINHPKIVSLIPILKGDKNEFLIEKGTELGIDQFILFSSRYTIPKWDEKKVLSFKEKALNALKQSGRLFLPEINFCKNLSSFLRETMPKERNSLKLFASPTGTISLQDLIKKTYIDQSKQIILLSGPEGGLSEEEQYLVHIYDFIEVNLSSHILRAETASFALMVLATLLRNSLK
ncbi:MAG: RsmE family RNA methyltransferase [Caldimicrobium sp.]